jgi:mono/diheme cytochrome c family protein
MYRKLLRTILALTIAGLTLTGAAMAQQESKAEKQKLFLDGARLWPVYCSQCHNARPGSQFSPAQWDIIMMHMRTQSNMPAKDANAIKEYLKGGL